MCRTCQDTGSYYQGNGQRKKLYPFSEGHVAVTCGCEFGQILRDQNARTVFPDHVLLEVAEREYAERMRAQGKVPCRGDFCTSWIYPNDERLCDDCKRRYWRE